MVGTGSIHCWPNNGQWTINDYSSNDLGYLKILEIPKGARHLLIQEFKGTPHILGKRKGEDLVLSNLKNSAHHWKSNFHCFLLQRWRTRTRVTSSSMVKTSSQKPEWWLRRVWCGSTATRRRRSPSRPQVHWSMESCSWSVCQQDKPSPTCWHSTSTESKLEKQLPTYVSAC